MAILSVVLLIGFIVMAVGAPYVAPDGPYVSDLRSRLQPPSMEHPLGTDQLGRDMLDRIVWGSRVALLVGFVAIVLGLVIGGFLGLVAGYFGGIVDTIIMRFMDLILSFPYILLVIAVVALLGPSITNAMIAIGITTLPEFSRVMRSVVIGIRMQEYVQASTSLGASTRRVLFVHVLPNSIGPLIVLATVVLGKAILAEASLSFLGLGVQPPDPSWGTMVANGRDYLRTHPYLSIAPGVAVMLVVFALNIFGDALRDYLDPRS